MFGPPVRATSASLFVKSFFLEITTKLGKMHGSIPPQVFGRKINDFDGYRTRNRSSSPFAPCHYTKPPWVSSSHGGLTVLSLEFGVLGDALLERPTDVNDGDLTRKKLDEFDAMTRSRTCHSAAPLFLSARTLIFNSVLLCPDGKSANSASNMLAGHPSDQGDLRHSVQRPGASRCCLSAWCS